MARARSRTTAEPPSTSLTTADLKALLVERYPEDRWALFFDVPDAVGVAQNRRADAIAAGLWKTVGHHLHGFELKVSRGDWRRELAQVQKADPFLARCDYWWLVTSDPSIATLEELPACWGWLAATAGGLRVQRPATRLPQPEQTLDRLFVLGLLRQCQQDAKRRQPALPPTAAALAAAEERIAREVEYRVAQQGREARFLAERVAAFEARSGISLDDFRLGAIGDAVRAIAAFGRGPGGLQAVDTLLGTQADELARLLERVQAARAAIRQADPASGAGPSPAGPDATG